MGLIKAAVSAVSSTLGDQWKEAIRCDDMTGDVLMVRKTTPTGVITNGSTIIVAPGQCAILYDNGKVIDATAEDGIYKFDESSSPSFFAGQFKETFKEMWSRFTYDGATSKQQAVFFFNLKEIMDNKFGTSTPIPFQDWSHPIPNRMTNTMSPLSVKVRCYGTYTFKIDNPAVFMQELAGTADIYYTSSVVGQMRSEVIAAFQNVLNELGNSEHKVPVLEMPSQTDEMKQMMEERIFDEPIRRRGIRLISFSVESVSLEEESEKKINEYELGSNSYMQQGRMTTAYANAVENAAQNANGAANGFMGIGMMNMATGGMMGGNATSPWQNQGQQGNSVNYNPYENQQQPQAQNMTQAPQNQVQENVMQGNMQQPQESVQQATQPQVQENVSPEPQNQVQESVMQENIPQPQESMQEVSQAQVQENVPQEPQNQVQENVMQENISQPQESVQEVTQLQAQEVTEGTQNQVQSPEESANGNLKMCKRCGNMNPSNSKFCNNCGNEL